MISDKMYLQILREKVDAPVKYGIKMVCVCVYIVGKNGGYVNELMERIGEDYIDGVSIALDYLSLVEKVIKLEEGKIEIIDRGKLDVYIGTHRMLEEFGKKIINGAELENRVVDKDILKYLQEENLKIKRKHRELDRECDHAYQYYLEEVEKLNNKEDIDTADVVEKVFRKLKAEFTKEDDDMLRYIIENIIQIRET